LYGTQKSTKALVEFVSRAKQKIDSVIDSTAPSVIIEVDSIRKERFAAAKDRGVKFRYVIEITKDNLSYCKEMLKFSELRHLDGVKGNFEVSDIREYVAATTLQGANKQQPMPQLIYSNVKEVVEQQQYIFDTLWNTTIPAEQKIREIEQGEMHYETRIIDNADEIVKAISRLTASSNELATCLTSGGMQYSHKYFFDVKKKLLDKQKRGEHKGLRYVTNIDNQNLHIAKIYLDYGIQIKHVRNLPPMSFGVSDKEIAATIEKMEEGKVVQSLLISNESVYVKHFTAIFEELWRNGIDAKSRIQDIDNGVDSEDIEIIQNPYEIQKLTFELVKSATNEMLIIFSTANAFHRQEYAGLMQLLKEVAIERGVKIRMLVPKDDLIDEKVQQLQQHQFYQQVQRQEQLRQQVDIRYIEQHLQTKVSFLVVDSKYSLVVELKDDTKKTSYEAIGLATYSNSKSTVLSYVSIFETLWKQTELYQKLSELYEQLQVHDKMQKEFINVAAHELRTPIQPILSITGILKSKIKDNEQNDLFDIIARNAKRLQRLTEDILDVTRIESGTLELKNELFSIDDIIRNIVQDYKSHIEKKNSKFNLKLLYEPKEKDSTIFVQADKERIIQVISNMVDNAIKFTSEGSIGITTERIKEDRKEEVVISIKDTGTGIDPEMMPKLFSKFASKSYQGTGLGLFICKSIIDAHGGRVWVEHNSDGRGATFSFSLPINSRQTVK
jgi:signal transduction histidine kinase